MTGPRIAIFGAGAVGGYLAVRLAHAGRNVAIVARGEQLAAIRKAGLTLEAPDETITAEVEASDDAAALGPADIVLVTLKTTANAAVPTAIAPLLHDRTQVVFVQNGVFWWYGQGFTPGVPFDTTRLDPDGSLARAIPAERAMGLVVYSPNEVVAPGRIVCTLGDCHFHLGQPVTVPGTRETVAGALACPGLRVELPADIRQAMWKKLLLNLSTAPFCTLTRATASGLDEEPALSDVARSLVEEAMRVAAAHGFDDLGIDPAALTRPGARLPHKPSMLQDLERGRPLEIDSMLTIVQDFARSAEVATPTLDIVVALLTQLARTRGLYPAAG
jgi:2-dehydropantoate 2-reductase